MSYALRYAKVLAIAKNKATDPGTRAIAEQWLEKNRAPPEKKRVAGVEPSEDYLRWRRSQAIKRK
jgi:hypothetical protein